MTAAHSELGAFHLPSIFARERTRLVGLCATLTGVAEVAEDLAQETLFEAWKHRASLLHQERCSEWLSGIARNVCRRWWQREGHAWQAPLHDGAEEMEALADEI